MTRWQRNDEGVAALEMALVLGLILMLAFGAVPLYRMGDAYHTLSRVSAETLRYASATTPNATLEPDGVTLTRRPTSAMVAAFAQQAAGNTTVTVVTMVCPGDVSTACAVNDPSTAVSGAGITVQVSTSVDLSEIGSVANAVGSFLGIDNIAPNGVVTLTSTAHGREE